MVNPLMMKGPRVDTEADPPGSGMVGNSEGPGRLTPERMSLGPPPRPGQRPTLPPKVVPPMIPADGAKVEHEFTERFRHFLKGDPPKEMAQLVRELADAWEVAMVAHRSTWEKPSPFETDLARYAKVDKAARPRLAKALGKAEAALERVRTQPGALSEAAAKLAAPADSPVAEMRQAELRSYLRSLGQKERSEALSAAINAGDVATLGAVLAAPAMLSGLLPSEFESLRHRALRRLSPEAVAAEDRRETLEKQLQLILGRYQTWTAAMFPEPPAA